MSAIPVLPVTKIAARRFMRRILALDTPHPGISAALSYHGYIQIDPINISGRMHDLILRNRVAGYREGSLMRHLHGDGGEHAKTGRLPIPLRKAFEHHVPGTGILVAFPLEAWPHLIAAMRGWSRARGAWAGRLTPREKVLAQHLLAEIAVRGPLGSEDFDDERRARKIWGASKLVKATLQKLFFHGRLLIAQRLNHRRRYDLPERVLPPAVLGQPEPPAGETARWLALLKLRQRRLVQLKRSELLLVADAVVRVAIEGCPALYCLRDDAAALEAAQAEADPRTAAAPLESSHAKADAGPTLLIAPLDPLIYDRRVTAALWNFDYTWEAYTPALKRQRGYYALPVLAGTELVGHVDTRADRAARKLVVVSRRIRRGYKVVPALNELAHWLGLRRR